LHKPELYTAVFGEEEDEEEEIEWKHPETDAELQAVLAELKREGVVPDYQED
jgi:hypothetical protein